MAYIKQQLHVARRPEFVAKTQHLNAQERSLSPGAVSFKQDFAQRMHRMIRSVYNLVGQRAHSFHRLTFGANRIEQTFAAVSGVRPPRLAKTPCENLI